MMFSKIKNPSIMMGLVGLMAVPEIFLANAHRSLPSGVSCGSQFSSPETALTIPNTKISWASYRVFDCDDPVFWLEAEADENQQLKFTVNVPNLDRFEDVRMSVVIIGPSLPALPDDANVPDAVVDALAGDGGYMGAVLYESRADQSNCDHLKAIMGDASSVVDNRCNFYEPFAGSNSWVVMDEEFAVQASGLHKIAVFVEGGTSAKATFACCDWPEDFITNYNIPEIDCPFCGTQESENPAWGSLFYEQKSMAEHGGFPPAISCNDPGANNLEPSEDQCPPLMESGEVDAQPPSCNLGCSNDGECHSHNVFGECTHSLSWSIQPKFGDAPVKKVIIFKGDKIDFNYEITEGMVHNLFMMPDETALEQCSFEESEALADVEEIMIGHTITFDKTGTFHFSCGISCTGFPVTIEKQIPEEGIFDATACHCSLGQKLTVEVKDSTEGMRCHDHAQPSSDTVMSSTLTCAEGQVNARAIGNKDYGAMDETQCAELCTPPMALDFMFGVDAGTCADEAFVYDPVTMMVDPPNSPSSVAVQITSNVSVEPPTCHCHSYEEIECPGDEIDTLYAEHIEEIETYCTGILDGSVDVCQYKCFQPMEVLHLHYLECETRTVDPTYLAVNATNKCHIAATAPEGTDCPEVSLGKGNDNNNDSGDADLETASGDADPETASGDAEQASSSAMRIIKLCYVAVIVIGSLVGW